jgi:hypothetical protein
MGLREAEGLLHVMTRECGGDPAATDATRVLRLPGFANKKYETNLFVEVRKESAQIYRLRDFKLDRHRLSGPAALQRSRARQTSRFFAGQPEPVRIRLGFCEARTRSWRNPEEVIRRIARYRATSKSDPLYYARHTVMKAAELFRQNFSTENKKYGRRDSKEEVPSEH